MSVKTKPQDQVVGRDAAIAPKVSGIGRCLAQPETERLLCGKGNGNPLKLAICEVSMRGGTRLKLFIWLMAGSKIN